MAQFQNTSVKPFGNSRPTRSGTRGHARLVHRVQASSVSPLYSSSLELSHHLAASRAKEHGQGELGLVADPFASHLAQTSAPLPEPLHSMAAISTAYFDEVLMKAAALYSENSINSGDYRQIVLVGDALDTRPFRLPWAPGTVVFIIAPKEANEAAKQLVQQTLTSETPARVPRGCLLRRVNAELQNGEPFMDALMRAGFRADRVSVWALQGVAQLGLATQHVHAIFNEITSAAAYHSLVFGELPAMTKQEAEELIASYGLLASILPYGREPLSYGRWQEEWSLSGEERQPYLFSSQHVKLSLVQMGVYDTHVVAAEESDEDFFGNFS